MASWFWGLADPVTAVPGHPPQAPGGVFMELVNARSRKLTVVCDPSTSDSATFTMSGRDPSAAYVTELESDLVVQRDSSAVFRGRVLSSGDTLDAGRHDAAFIAASYRELLKRRTLANLSTLSYTNADPAAIVWALMDYAQTQPSGNLGISRGANAAGIGLTRSVTYGKTDNVFDDVQALASMDDGFDWNITPHAGKAADLRLDLWPGGLQVQRGVVLEWGGDLVATATRTFDSAGFANKMYATGDTSASLTPVSVDNGLLGSDPRGRWESVVSTTEAVQSALAARAAYLMAQYDLALPSWQLVLRQGAWDGPGHIWAGDVVTWRVKSGRLNEDTPYRVSQLDITPNDNGSDQVTVTIGQLPTTLIRTVQHLKRKVGPLHGPVFP